MRACLIYPNKKDVGLSNLGFQKIYRSFTDSGIECDIAFASEDKHGEIFSEKLKKPLADFYLLAFSITFEMDEINFLDILKRSNIPLESKDRLSADPLVLVGGVAVTLNPEPLSQFVDFFVIGEGELVIDKIVSVLSSEVSRDEKFKKFSALNGIYVPSLYKVEHGENGAILNRVAIGGAPESVERLINVDYSSSGMAQLEGVEGSIFAGTYLIEAGKGCGQGCRFCAAGFIYRPVRHVEKQVLEKQVDEGLKNFGRIGFVGSAICEHPDIESVYEYVTKHGGEVTVSSLRIGLASKETFESLAKGGCKTVTVAPEAGSERLRRVINKEIREEEILEAVENAVSSGIPNFKAYFLIGLPTETDEDVDALLELAQKMQKVFISASRPMGRAGKITISVNPFIPKPFTPFQWEAMEPIDILKKKVKLLQKGISKISNVEFKSESIRESAVQALLSVGGREAGQFLLDVSSGRSWSEILKTAEAKNIYLRQKEEGEILPWGFIDPGFHKDYLWKEYLRSKEGKASPPCPPLGSGCHKCGDFYGVCS